ncbi:hypothetical protein FDW83_14360 [Pseudarthrobacter sp. NamE2]|nr:hypothetical protein FDW83_14360 [Pseudarthrobacter sp. NamE2]
MVLIGLFLLVAFLLAILVLCEILWIVGKTVWWLLELVDGTVSARRRASSLSRRNAMPVSARPGPPGTPPAPVGAGPTDPSGIWPKWNASHRRYKDQELALWQEQFDALKSRE